MFGGWILYDTSAVDSQSVCVGDKTVLEAQMILVQTSPQSVLLPHAALRTLSLLCSYCSQVVGECHLKYHVVQTFCQTWTSLKSELKSS